MELLGLRSELRQGRFSFEYLFPIPGTYHVEAELSPTPGGEDFPPTSWRREVRIRDDAPPVWSHWLLLGGVFALGALLGGFLTQHISGKKRPPAVMGLACLVGLWLISPLVSPAFVGADHPVASMVQFPRGAQVIKGDDGWELVVRPTPAQAKVGEPLHLAIALNKDGSPFTQGTEVTLNIYQLRDDQPILRTQVLAPSGFVSQRLQLFDSAPHTCTVTARAVGRTGDEPRGLTAVLGVDVASQAPALTAKLRAVAVVSAMLGGGLVAGYLIPRIGKETGRA
jgi:hypothetical protein